MTSMRSANGCNFTSVAGGTEPVVNRRADAATLDWRLAGTMVASYQKQDAVAPSDCPVKRTVDRQPGAVEIEPMKVENLIGFDRT